MTGANRAGRVMSRCGLRRGARVQRLQVAVGVERGHAAGAGRGDRLAIDVVGDVAGGEHAGDAGRGGIALAAALDHDIAAVHRELAVEESRCWACGRWR